MQGGLVMRIDRVEPLKDWVRNYSGWKALVAYGLVDGGWVRDDFGLRVHSTAVYHFQPAAEDSNLIELSNGIVINVEDDLVR